MAKIKSKVSQIQPQSSRQEIVQNISQSQQQVVHRIKPHYPSWPTSKPGPQSTPPLVGMRSVNPFRPEQIAEIDSNRETDQPSVDSPLYSAPDASIHGSTSFDQSKNAQDTLGKRKRRL
jgi:hypothetical protein